MAITATIGGSARKVQPDINLSWRLGGRGTANITVYDPATEPQAGAPVSIYEDGVRIWSGSVDDVEKTLAIAPGVAKYQYRMRLVSQEYRLSYRLVKPATTTADPSSTYAPLSGVVNVGGTSVIWVSGDKFDPNLEQTKIVIGGGVHTVASVTDSEHLELATSASSGTGIAYTWTPWAGNILLSIAHHWLQGENITIGTVEMGDDVGKQVFDHVAVADIYTQLAEASDSIWYVNPEGELNFHARTTVTAGTAITASRVLEAEQPTIVETREDLCNARYQRISYNALDPDAATVPGDGTSKAFWIGAPISVITAGSIEIGGQFFVCQFGLRGVDTGKDFYYSPGENKLTQDASYSGTVIAATNASPVEIQTAAPHGLASGHLAYVSGILGNTSPNGQFWRINVTDTDKFELVDCEGNGDYVSGGSVEANQALDPGDYLRFNYRRLGSDVIGYEDGTAITARASVEGTSGRYERIEEQTDSVDAGGALSLATAIVEAHKATRVQLRLATDTTGYQPGQLVDVTLSDFGLSADPYLIEEISARVDIDGKLRYSLSLVDGQVIGGWRKVFESLRSTRKSSSLAVISGGSVVGSTSGSGGGGGYTPAAFADNVTILSPATRKNDDGTFDVLIPYNPPSPIGTFAGVYVYLEAVDQSNLTESYADGSSTADGNSNVGGEWKPEQVTKKEHVSGEPVVFTYKGEVNSAVSIRVYLNSYNTEGVENELIRASDAGATPSVVVTITPITIGAIGEEYCKNPTNPACTVSDSFEGGISVVRVEYTYDVPENGSGAYVEIPYKDADGNDKLNVSVSVGGKGASWFPNPKTTQVTSARFRGFVDQFPGVTDDLVNSYEPLVTPEVIITIGKEDGTVDLGEGLTASVTAAMQVLNKVLGVATNGITNDLIAIFAVSQDRLANAQIIDAARIVDAAVQNSKLADLAVDTSKLAALSVDNSKLQDLIVDSAKLAGSAVTSTKIANLAVGTSAIALLAVGTAQIGNLAVDNSKIANLAVDNAKIGALAVTSAKIANASVGTLQLVDANVTTAKIANLAVTNALIGSLAVATGNIQDLAVTNAKINDLSVNKLTAGAISVAATTLEAIAVTATVLGNTLTTALRPDMFKAYHSAGSYSSLTALGVLTLYNSSSANTFEINPASGLTSTTATGGAATLPANPVGFLNVSINNVSRRIPYYS